MNFSHPFHVNSVFAASSFIDILDGVDDTVGSSWRLFQCQFQTQVDFGKIQTVPLAVENVQVIT